jgi:hypothetical protein
MARRVFFSFHYQKDIFRVNQVRMSNIVGWEAASAAGFHDASLWEEAKRKGDAAVKALINSGLNNTSVTVVLIGSETASRKYVTYEVEKSIERGNGLLGIYIHQLKDISGLTSLQGSIPEALRKTGAPVYSWDRNQFGKWVEEAYQEAQRKKNVRW